MKFITYLIFIIITLLVFGYFFLFTANGNRVLVPFINDYLTHKLPSHLEVKLDSFQTTPSHLNAVLILNKSVHLQLDGPVVWRTQQFDLQCRLQGKDFRIGEKLFPGSVEMNGTVKGNVRRFTADMEVLSGRVDSKRLHEVYGINLPEDFLFSGSVHATFEQKQLYGWGALKTTLGNLVLHESRYDLLKKRFDSDYHLFISDLSVYQYLTNQNLRGSMEVSGHIQVVDGLLRGYGETESFGGKINAVYENGDINATLKDVSLRQLLYTVYYPQVAAGNISGELDYSLVTGNGEMNGTVADARLLQNPLTKALESFESIDLSKERFDKTLFHATMQPYQIFFDLNASAPQSHIRIYNGQIKQMLHFVRSDFDINLQGKTFRGHIRGDLSSPQVELDTVDYIENRVGTTIDKYIDKEDQRKIKNVVKKGLKNFGIEDLNTTKIMKGMMDIFF